MQSSGGVHLAVAMAKVSSWMGLMQTNEGVHMGTYTIAIAATQCEQALSPTSIYILTHLFIPTWCYWIIPNICITLSNSLSNFLI